MRPRRHAAGPSRQVRAGASPPDGLLPGFARARTLANTAAFGPDSPRVARGSREPMQEGGDALRVTHVEELGLPRPRVDADLVLRLQKYRNPDRVSPVVREAARRMASLAEVLVEPRG